METGFEALVKELLEREGISMRFEMMPSLPIPQMEGGGGLEATGRGRVRKMSRREREEKEEHRVEGQQEEMEEARSNNWVRHSISNRNRSDPTNAEMAQFSMPPPDKPQFDRGQGDAQAPGFVRLERGRESTGLDKALEEEDLDVGLSQADPNVLKELPPEIMKELRMGSKSKRMRSGIKHFLIRENNATTARPNSITGNRGRSREDNPDHGDKSRPSHLNRHYSGGQLSSKRTKRSLPLSDRGPSRQMPYGAVNASDDATHCEGQAIFVDTTFDSLRPTLVQWLPKAGPLAVVVLQTLASQWFDQCQLLDIAALLRFLSRNAETDAEWLVRNGVEELVQKQMRARYGGPLAWHINEA